MITNTDVPGNILKVFMNPYEVDSIYVFILKMKKPKEIFICKESRKS